MKIFWNDCGRGVASSQPKDVDLHQAALIWSDEVRGVKGNFLGLVDEHGRTIQFYFDEGVPDDVDDASYLRIVFMDFPVPEKSGSFGAQVTIGEVHGLIEKAFQVGADHRRFEGVTFSSW
jgi:hypothetical protein